MTRKKIRLLVFVLLEAFLMSGLISAIQDVNAPAIVVQTFLFDMAGVAFLYWVFS